MIVTLSGFSESRQIKPHYRMGEATPFSIEPVPHSEIRTIQLRLPSGKILNLAATENDLALIAKEMMEDLKNPSPAP